MIRRRFIFLIFLRWIILANITMIAFVGFFLVALPGDFSLKFINLRRGVYRLSINISDQSAIFYRQGCHKYGYKVSQELNHYDPLSLKGAYCLLFNLNERHSFLNLCP